MNGIYNKKVWSLEDIEEIYHDICIMKNEDDIEEMSFKDQYMAEKFLEGASQLWPLWIDSENTITMYFFAKILEDMYSEKYITKDDLYQLSELEIIELIKKCENRNISDLFVRFLSCTEFIECNHQIEHKFCVSRKVKRRYINPLTQNGRIYDVSMKAKNMIDGYINMEISDYAYIDI